MSRFIPLLGAVLISPLVGLGGVQSARGEVVLGPAPVGTIPSYYDRFSGGFPDNPASTTNNPTFYLSSLDLSGVGWRLPGIFGPGGGAAWNVAMIDNIHFIGAWHAH